MKKKVSKEFLFGMLGGLFLIAVVTVWTKYVIESVEDTQTNAGCIELCSYGQDDYCPINEFKLKLRGIDGREIESKSCNYWMSGEGNTLFSSKYYMVGHISYDTVTKEARLLDIEKCTLQQLPKCVASCKRKVALGDGRTGVCYVGTE